MKEMWKSVNIFVIIIVIVIVKMQLYLVSQESESAIKHFVYFSIEWFLHSLASSVTDVFPVVDCIMW